MPVSTTFHDVLDPISGTRTSIRIEAGRSLEQSASLPGDTGANVDGSGLWVLPALYDADAHYPLLTFGLRESDVFAALHGGGRPMPHLATSRASPWRARLASARQRSEQ